jgi:CRP/FNR family transcriptional regulator
MKSDRLKELPLFSFLSDPARNTLAKEVTETCYAKGEFIFREGDPADYFHILKEGAVKCVKSNPDGKEVTLKLLMPGDLFCCEAAVFDGGGHPGCAKPLGDATVLRVSKKAYYAMLREHPEAALDVIKYLGNRLNEAQEKAKVLALDQAEQRMAALLVTLAQRTGVKDTDGIRLMVPLTRQDLADMAGITVETAIRIMSRFKKAGFVTGTAKKILVQNLQQLKDLASV